MDTREKQKESCTREVRLSFKFIHLRYLRSIAQSGKRNLKVTKKDKDTEKICGICDFIV